MTPCFGPWPTGRSGIWLAGWALAASAATATAQQTLPTPSEFAACLTLPPEARVEYPREMLERREGGTIRVELLFSRSDRPPRVEILPSAPVAQALEDAVRDHARRLRMPCLPSTAAPVRLRQDYVFAPNDGRKVVASAPEEVDPEHQRQLGCIAHRVPGSVPEYSSRARRTEEQGTVLLRLTFQHPEQPPAIEVLAQPKGPELARIVTEHASGLRMPCLTTPPVRTTRSYTFSIVEGERVVLKDMSLRGFIGLARKAPRGVFFALDTMDCPFDLRVTYWQPQLRNAIRQLDRDVPQRRAFLDWLAEVELRLDAEDHNRVLGQEFTLRVPCGSVNL